MAMPTSYLGSDHDSTFEINLSSPIIVAFDLHCRELLEHTDEA